MRTGTFAAIVTGRGQSGIAIVALRGRDARRIAAELFRPSRQFDIENAADGALLYGHVFDGEKMIDEALLAIHAFPNEIWQAEINCHGGFVSVRMVTEVLKRAGVEVVPWRQFLLLSTEGDRAAREAKLLLAEAKTERALRMLAAQAAGALSRALRSVCSAVERGDLEAARRETADLLDTASLGRFLTESAKLCIAGAPNVGKSSLLNALVGSQRSLVYHVPGTTRDVVTADWAVRGIPVVFYDTAGIRQTEDEVELEGVRLARLAVREADLVLFVVDTSLEAAESRPEMLRELGPVRKLLIANKCDLPPRFDPCKEGSFGGLPVAVTSAKTGEGIENLALAIEKELLGDRAAGKGGQDESRAVVFARELAEDLSRVHGLLCNGNIKSAKIMNSEIFGILGRWLGEK